MLLSAQLTVLLVTTVVQVSMLIALYATVLRLELVLQSRVVMSTARITVRMEQLRMVPFVMAPRHGYIKVFSTTTSSPSGHIKQSI